MTPQLSNVLAPLLPGQARDTSLWFGHNLFDFHHQVRKPVMQASGLPYRKRHTLRHTYASLLLARGVSVAYVKAQLAHASIKMTVGTYDHYMPAYRERFVDRLDDVSLGSGITPESPRAEDGLEIPL